MTNYRSTTFSLLLLLQRGRMFLAVVLLLVICCCNVGVQCDQNTTISSAGSIIEYCETESFVADCKSADEVIIVQSAYFGRMRLGKCLTVNNGNLGCQLDVVDQLEAKCSGRRRCQVPVASIDHSMLPCTREVRGYLEASFVCVTVASKPMSECKKHQPIEIHVATTAYATSVGNPAKDSTRSAAAGYLASVVTDETGCGSLDTPWIIRAPAGQTIRLKLLDFGIRAAATGRDLVGSGNGQVPLTCQVYAVVKEKNVGRNSETVCASDQRESLVYLSNSNQVEVRLVTAQKNHKADYFLIRYEVVGCPDLMTTWSSELDAAHWVERTGDVVVFGCNGSSSQTWQLMCEGHKWIGERKSCSPASASKPMSAVSVNIWNAFTGSQWAAIVVILIIAISIGMVIFIVGLIYLKRARSRRLDRMSRGCSGGCGGSGGDFTADYHLALTAGGDNNPQTPTKSVLQQPIAPGFASHTGGGSIPSSGPCPPDQQQSENDYFRTWQLHSRQQVLMPGCSHTGGIATRAGPPPHLGFQQQPHSGRPAPGSLHFVPAAPQLPSSTGGTPRRVIPEHIYESPRLERREFVPLPVVPSPSSTVLTGAPVTAECTCCGVDRTMVPVGVPPPPLGGGSAEGGPLHRQTPILQYYELDQSSRPGARV
jgi:hypothetical protein